MREGLAEEVIPEWASGGGGRGRVSVWRQDVEILSPEADAFRTENLKSWNMRNSVCKSTEVRNSWYIQGRMSSREREGE